MHTGDRQIFRISIVPSRGSNTLLRADEVSAM